MPRLLWPACCCAAGCYEPPRPYGAAALLGHNNGWLQWLLLPERCCSTGCCEPMPPKVVAARAAAQGVSTASL